jgi:uncharacterized protein YkwD
VIILRRSAVVFLATLGGCSAVQLPGSTSTAAGATVPADVIRFINDARVKNGLPMLATSSKLNEAARIQAEQMARARKLEHTITGSAHPTLESRMQAVDYIYSSAAENVAWNQASSQAAVNSWMSSSGHRANILDRGFKEIGAAVARSANGDPYWVVVFAIPR